jgi:hypothetical protein
MRVLELAAQKVLILRSPPKEGVSKDDRKKQVTAPHIGIFPQ